MVATKVRDSDAPSQRGGGRLAGDLLDPLPGKDCGRADQHCRDEEHDRGDVETAEDDPDDGGHSEQARTHQLKNEREFQLAHEHIVC